MLYYTILKYYYFTCKQNISLECINVDTHTPGVAVGARHLGRRLLDAPPSGDRGRATSSRRARPAHGPLRKSLYYIILCYTIPYSRITILLVDKILASLPPLPPSPPAPTTKYYYIDNTINNTFFFLISRIADGPHHYHPACGH